MRWAVVLVLVGCGDDSVLPVVDAPIADSEVIDAPDERDAAPILCTANGIPGECKDVAACTGYDHPTPGVCPGPANIQCCTPRITTDCDEAAMPNPNAGLTEEPGDTGCPAGMAHVATFCIDRFEAALDNWSPYWNPGAQPPRAVSLRGAVPQAYISGTQAAAACAAAGKRLCTDAEWLRACQGPTGTTYPYGNTREPGVCNDHRDEHPAVQLYGTSDAWIFTKLDNPCIDQLPMSLAPAGSYTGCITAEGLHDMMGNLHEWTADPNGTFRGGYYVDTVMNGNGCLYVTTAHD